MSTAELLIVSYQVHVGALIGHAGSHCLKGLDVQVDGTWSQITASWQPNNGLTKAT